MHIIMGIRLSSALWPASCPVLVASQSLSSLNACPYLRELVQASGKAKQKMAAVVDADSEVEAAASDSDFEPGKEAEAESEVGRLLGAWLRG